MFLDRVLPSPADNQYKGNRLALWFFVGFLMLMTWRSIIHMLFEKTGLHDIAHVVPLTGNPDPMPLIYAFFSLWGFAQLIFCAVCWVVVIRYKSLISLMYLFWLIEWSMRAFLYPLLDKTPIASGIYTDGPSPGVDGAPFVIFVLLVFLGLSLHRAKPVTS